MRPYYCIVLCVFIFLTACSKSTPEAPSPPPASKTGDTLPQNNKQEGIRIEPQSRGYLTVETIQLVPDATTVNAPARVEFRDKALSTVGSIVNGRLAGIKVQAGDHVKAGSILAIIESPEIAQARSDVLRAQAELAKAQDRVHRQSLMLQSGVGLEIERVEANTALQQAQADYARSVQASQSLGDGLGQMLSLRAPVDGVVLKVNATTGEAVTPGVVLFELGSPNALRVVADVFENDLHFIKENDKATLRIATVPQPVAGHVSAIGGAMANDLRRVSVYIEIDDAQILNQLKPGMFIDAAIKSNTAGQQVLLPSTALLIKDAKQTIVYVEVADGLFQARNVVASPAHEGVVAVHEGLANGDRVVTKGALLIDGEAQLLL